jgi:hypothetical protein
MAAHQKPYNIVYDPFAAQLQYVFESGYFPVPASVIGSAAGVTSDVQFNVSGLFAADPTFTFAAGLLSSPNVTASGTVTCADLIVTAQAVVAGTAPLDPETP